MAVWRIGVDVGGTFTDFAALDIESGRLLVDKVPTTSANPSLGILSGLQRLLERGVAPNVIDSFLHGTTITTNALIELKGARVGLLLTAGLRGIADVQSGLRYGNLTNLFYERPTSLAELDQTFEIPERLSAAGSEVEPLDESAVRRAARALKAASVSSVAVCYLFSYANPAHELRTKQILMEEMPKASVSASCEILARIREWPRMSATLLNAYLEPLLIGYIDALRSQLREHGLTTEQLYLMQSNGGVMPFSAVLVGGKTIHTLLSGPAGGVKAGARFASLEGLSNLITMDIGGTSCDIAFIERGRPLEVTEGEVDRREISVPMLDVTAIGAGGGTLAWLDAAGALNLGPRSAGADPGPVSYGRGGVTPTVTDANLVLGFLNPDYFLGGRVKLDHAAAQHAIDEQIARPLGMDVVQAAHSIVQIVNTRMADKIRVLASRRAITLEDMTLVAGGGAGAVHAAAVAEEMGVGRVLSPPNPGAFSAIGLLCTDVVHDYVQSDVRLLRDLPIDHIQLIYSAMESRATQELRQEGFGEDADIRFVREADVRYAGQGFEIRVPIAPGQLEDVEKDELTVRFNQLHQRLRGHAAEAEPVEMVTYRLRAEVPVEQYRPRPLSVAPEQQPLPRAAERERLVSFQRELPPILTAVWRREHLRVGTQLPGPAIVEQVDATTVIPPNWVGSVDAYGNLILQRRGGPG